MCVLFLSLIFILMIFKCNILNWFIYLLPFSFPYLFLLLNYIKFDWAYILFYYIFLHKLSI